MANNASLDFALDLILKHEGGYVNDPNDPGGETKYGISKRAYPAIDIANLTESQARKIYTNDYYLKARCEQLPVGVDLVVFDMAVNAGVKRAIQLLQTLVGCDADGIIGPNTLKAVREWNGDVITGYTVARINYYRKLKTWVHFGSGWAYRAAVTGHEAMNARKKLGIV